MLFKSTDFEKLYLAMNEGGIQDMGTEHFLVFENSHFYEIKRGVRDFWTIYKDGVWTGLIYKRKGDAFRNTFFKAKEENDELLKIKIKIKEMNPFRGVFKITAKIVNFGGTEDDFMFVKTFTQSAGIDFEIKRIEKLFPNSITLIEGGRVNC